MATQNC